MNVKKSFILGIIVISLVAYTILKFKIAPCSQELEILLNGRQHD